MEHIMEVDYFASSPHTQQLELLNMMLQLQQLAEAELSPNHNAHLSTPPPPLDSSSQAFGYLQHGLTSLQRPPSPTLPNNNITNIPAPVAVGNEEAMREMMFRIAAMQPVDVDPETVRRPTKRRNVRISKDPQSVAARQRRERISERMRILQHMVPGGTKMDTASMLDEAIQYVKFLKTQVQSLERAAAASQLRVPGRMQTMYQTQEHGLNIYAIANPYN